VASLEANPGRAVTWTNYEGSAGSAVAHLKATTEKNHRTGKRRPPSMSRTRREEEAVNAQDQARLWGPAVRRKEIDERGERLRIPTVHVEIVSVRLQR
jgi:hypothetical protein